MRYLLINQFNEVRAWAREKHNLEALRAPGDRIVKANHFQMTINAHTRTEWLAEDGNVYPAPKRLSW